MSKIFHVMYDDDAKVMEAAKDLVGQGIRVKDVYSPFPIHGIDPIIGIKRTRLAICSFMIQDWPMNIGGKPSFSLIENVTAFIPVTFEFSVLCGAHGMAITYLLRNGTLPGMPASNPDPRTTDDKFVVEITTDNNSMSADDIEAALRATDLLELSIKDA